jgi:zinc protease
MKAISASIAILAAAFTGICAAQTKITSVEGITEYRLDNGLDVLLFPDPSKPTFTVAVTYLVGSRHEGYGETGMAHLLEHMLFKGTDKLNEIGKMIQSRGGTYNGSTYYDRTNYFETFQDKNDNFKWALEMEAERMTHSRVSRADLDSEMTVVRNEFEMGENSPTRVLNERVMSTAYLWHGYGRSAIGSKSDIEHVPIDALQAFYRKYYQPDNAVLVVAGNFDETKALALIKDTFGPIPKPTRKLTETYTLEPTQDGEREVNLRRVGDMQAVIAAYHTPAAAHPDSAALEVMEEILDEAPAGRLYKALVTSKKATRESGNVFTFHDPGLTMFSAEVSKEGSVADVEKTMLATIDGMVKEPPTKEEVDRARTRLLKDIDLYFTDAQSVALQLSESASAGDWRLLFIDRDRIRKVTPEDVARVAKTYLKTSNLTLGRFIPEAKPDRAEVPATPEIAALTKDYKGDPLVAQGEVFDPSPANIDARTVRVTLPNGMKLVLVQKKTRGATVVASLNLHYGDEKSLFGKESAAQMTAALLMRGTKTHTRQQLQDELDKLKAQMNVGATIMAGTGVGINTVHAGLAGALRLAAEVLREPTFPESDFEQIRQASIARTESQRNEPGQLAMTSLYRHINPYPAGDPREFTSIDESIQALKALAPDDVRKFYNQFYGASNAELAIVGDFDAAEIQKLAAELFGNWKSPSPYSFIKRTVTKVTSANQMIETPDKTNAVFAAGLTTPLNDKDPDYAAMVFANSLIGGGSQSHLWQRIREKDGLSYGVASSVTGGIADNLGQFVVQAICNPQNVPKVEADFKDEMSKILRDGFAADEVATAKKAFLDERQVSRSDDGNLVRVLIRNAQFGYTMQRDAELEKKIAALTPEDVLAAMKRHIDASSISYFKGGDFKKAGVTQ